MSRTDPIADMLTRIRNACQARHKSVDIPSSKIKKQIAQILLEHKFVRNFVEIEDNRQNILRIFLKYTQDNRSVISGLLRISKPGLRNYVKTQDLGPASRHLGITILSTSCGMVTNQEARAKKIGGEVICRVW